jgi:hypothetical protein
MLAIADLGRWCVALVLGLVLLVALLIAAWQLRLFLPVVPTINLSADRMPASPAATGARDPMLALKASLDEAHIVETKLRAELASRLDDLRKRVAPCKLAGPSLQAERWLKGDLATLRGCWVLGRDLPMLHTLADGSKEQVIIQAGRICFDDQGGGWHEQVTIGPTARWNCRAPLTAKFWNNGTLVTNQPAVFCEGEPPMRWTATQLTCHRVAHDLALCRAVDKSGRTQLELRREPQ